MSIPKPEKISFFTHIIGLIGFIFATILIAQKTNGFAGVQYAACVYGGSAIFLFTASSLYHLLKKRENEVSIWRKMDHCAIFFMIAGTYTPICYIYLTGTLKWGIIITQWSLVILGLFFKIFFINAPRKLYTVIYIIMGWIILIPIREMVTGMPTLTFIYLLSGGIVYTTGAIIYAIKKPIIIPRFFGFHEIFHIFTLCAATLHFLMVYTAINEFLGI